jgi:hypothetical protein
MNAAKFRPRALTEPSGPSATKFSFKISETAYASWIDAGGKRVP